MDAAGAAQRLAKVWKAWQIIFRASEVTLNSSYCWECTKIGLDSGFGTIGIRPLEGLQRKGLWQSLPQAAQGYICFINEVSSVFPWLSVLGHA